MISEGMTAARELARLYATARLFVNAFQPSFTGAQATDRRPRLGAPVPRTRLPVPRTRL